MTSEIDLFCNFIQHYHERLNYSETELLEMVRNSLKSSSYKKNLFSPAENVVIYLYPQFQDHYKILIENGYMQKNGENLRWLKSKQCLAEYFGFLHKENNKKCKISWKEIHTLFNVTKLNYAYSRNGNVYKNESKDFKELKELLKLKKTPHCNF